MRKNRDFQKGKNNRARFGIAVFCLIMSVAVVFGNICGCSGKKLSANDMTPYEYGQYMADIFVGGDGSLWTNYNIISAKTANLRRWDPCEDLSGEQSEESDAALELIGLKEIYPAGDHYVFVNCNIINNSSKNFTVDRFGLDVKLGDEWYPALSEYSTTMDLKNFILYPGESTIRGAALYNDKNIVPPGRYRLEYSGTEPPAYLEFDLIEKDGVLSAVAAK